MRRPTLATLKSFIRKNRDALLIRNESRFDGMVDGVEPTGQKLFQKAETAEPIQGFDNTLGLKGAWIVGQSRDYIQPFKDGNLHGFHVDNCCGSFTVAVQGEPS